MSQKVSDTHFCAPFVARLFLPPFKQVEAPWKQRAHGPRGRTCCVLESCRLPGESFLWGCSTTVWDEKQSTFMNILKPTVLVINAALNTYRILAMYVFI